MCLWEEKEQCGSLASCLFLVKMCLSIAGVCVTLGHLWINDSWFYGVCLFCVLQESQFVYKYGLLPGSFAHSLTFSRVLFSCQTPCYWFIVFKSSVSSLLPSCLLLKVGYWSVQQLFLNCLFPSILSAFASFILRLCY